jgi:hypothetical protein
VYSAFAGGCSPVCVLIDTACRRRYMSICTLRSAFISASTSAIAAVHYIIIDTRAAGGVAHDVLMHARA